GVPRHRPAGREESFGMAKLGHRCRSARSQGVRSSVFQTPFADISADLRMWRACGAISPIALDRISPAPDAKNTVNTNDCGHVIIERPTRREVGACSTTTSRGPPLIVPKNP